MIMAKYRRRDNGYLDRLKIQQMKHDVRVVYFLTPASNMLLFRCEWSPKVLYVRASVPRLALLGCGRAFKK